MITQIYDLIYVLQDDFFSSSSHALLTQWPLVAATNLESFISFSERFSFHSYVWLCHFTTHELTIQWLASVHNITFKHMCEPQSPRLWSKFFCKCTTLLVLFSSSWTALQLSPALVPASFKYGRSWLLDCPQLPWQPAQHCFLSLPYHPSPAAEPEITPLPQHGIFVHKSDMHEQWSSNALHLWCHNIFCFFKVANKKQKITLIAVLIFIVVSLFICIASLPSLFLARYFSVTLSDGGRHTAWFLMKNNVTLSGQFEFCYKTLFQIATTHSQDSVHYQIQFTTGILCCY